MSLRPGKRLRYALARNPSRAGGIGCTFTAAAIFAALGYWFLRPRQAADDRIVSYLVATAFALLALFCVYHSIKQIFALRTRQTILEIDQHELRRGSGVPLFIQQFGPAEFDSLRVALVASGVTHGPFPIFENGPFIVHADLPFERMAVIHVPPDVPPSSTDARSRVTWALAVSGIIRGRADVEHSFPVRVV